MKTSTSHVQRYRRRQKEGRMLLPRIEIENTVADELVEAGFLGAWDTENPQAVIEAIVKLAMTSLRTDRNDISA
jgi:hypothetical protein